MTMRFVRRKKDGQSGEVVEVGGKKVFRVQVSPLETRDDPFRESDFTEDYPERMLNPMQVGMALYKFDQILREVFGDHSAKKDWAQLDPGTKSLWTTGPDFSKGHPARKRVYEAIKNALKEETS